MSRSLMRRTDSDVASVNAPTVRDGAASGTTIAEVVRRLSISRMCCSLASDASASRSIAGYKRALPVLITSATPPSSSIDAAPLRRSCCAWLSLAGSP
jgi:hypothetical protein